MLAKTYGVLKVDAGPKLMSITFRPNPPIDAQRIIELVQRNRHIKLAGNDRLRIERELAEPRERAQFVRDVLRSSGLAEPALRLSTLRCREASRGTGTPPPAYRELHAAAGDHHRRRVALSVATRSCPMTAFLRRFSQVSRVRAGFGFLALAVWAIGFTAAGALNSHAPEVALAIGAAAGIVGTLGLIGGWLVSVSIKAPVDDTAQAVMRIAAGDLETKIESPGRDETLLAAP